LENEKGENGGSDKRLKITEDAIKNIEIKLERESYQLRMEDTKQRKLCKKTNKNHLDPFFSTHFCIYFGNPREISAPQITNYIRLIVL